jgi:hypothetical protein
MDLKEPPTAICRPRNGTCDVAELCDGMTNSCPRDSFESSVTVCRDAAGDCDVPELCTGSSATCPIDRFAIGTLCRPQAIGKLCDRVEQCANSANCPPDLFAPALSKCDDLNSMTNKDACDDQGVCLGACVSDGACNDNNTCTEDTCSMPSGICRFTPIVGCVPEQPLPPPTNCLIDQSFRFDLLSNPGANDAGNSVTTCFFTVSLVPFNGDAVARSFAAGGNKARAVSFGIAKKGESEAKFHANTALTMQFASPWVAAIESVTVSSVGADTLLAVVRNSPTELQNIQEALRVYDQSGGNTTVTKGVWMVFKPGEQPAPPAVSFAPAAAWSVVWVRGRAFSLDAFKLSLPIHAERKLSWQPVPGGIAGGENSTTLVIAVPATQTPDDNSALIGGIVGGVVALLIVVGVIAFIAMRNRKAKANQQSTNDGHSLNPPAVLAQPSSNYDRIDIPSPSHYSERANVQSPTQNHYDSLKASEI